MLSEERHTAMNSIKFSAFIISFLSGFACFSQEKSIDTVVVFDDQMKKIKLFHQVQTLSAADIQKNSTSLSEVLRFQSPVYIKENGRGAVSSPSFRGTTAQQTAFVWNGININSQFLGQGDVNNISVFGYDQIEVKSGGGSVMYGSGAIGGSIHLNNQLQFNQGFDAILHSEAGSFGTFNHFIKTSYSNDKFCFKASANYLISENDYEVPEKRYTNFFGKFQNNTINIGAAYKINSRHTVFWQSQIYDGEQNYPVREENGNRSRYEVQTFRSLLSWDFKTKSFENSLKAAYTEDNFQYFGDVNAQYSSGGANKNYIIKNNFNYFFSPKWNVNVIGEFQQNQGEGLGTSGVGIVKRNVGSFSGLLRYFPSPKLRFEAGIKQDFVEDFTAPLLFSFSGKWSVFDFYSVSFNASKNFRYPSFNDLYWTPGGNPDLKAENSIQADLTQEFRFKNFQFSLTPYYMKIHDMIRWLSTSMGYWAPFNTNKVESFGVEYQLKYYKSFSENSRLRLAANYIFSRSVNLETGDQLMYVPLHKAAANVDFEYRFLKIYAQGMFTGLTYTTSNESRKDAIDPYFVMNAGIAATLKKKYTLGVRINNITDSVYETVAFYPLPKRNYMFYATFNF